MKQLLKLQNKNKERTNNGSFFLLIGKDLAKATPHKAHLTILHVIYLHIFRHITQILLAIRHKFMQSDEKSDCASDAQSLCGVALNIFRYNFYCHKSLMSSTNHYSCRNKASGFFNIAGFITANKKMISDSSGFNKICRTNSSHSGT